MNTKIEEHQSVLSESIDEEQKDHLVVLLHGVMGVPAHMQALSKEIVAVLGKRTHIFAPSCYSRLKSLQGTQRAGDSVFAGIKELIAKHNSTLKYISLIGYSFGGVVAFWLAGRLERNEFLGLSPRNFITIACPHLGATDPDVKHENLFQIMRALFVLYLGGETGAELSHCDDAVLLTWMADSASPFFKGLKAFHRRVTFANLRGDRTVPFYTAYFPVHGDAIDKLPGDWTLAGQDYPHVLTASESSSALDPLVEQLPMQVAVSLVALLPLVLLWFFIVLPIISTAIIAAAALRCVRRACCWRPPGLPLELAPPTGWAGGSERQGGGVQARMAGALNSLEWRKRAVLFTWRRDGLAAIHTHGHIVVRHPWLNGCGADVIRHVALDMLDSDGVRASVV